MIWDEKKTGRMRQCRVYRVFGQTPKTGLLFHRVMPDVQRARAGKDRPSKCCCFVRSFSGVKMPSGCEFLLVFAEFLLYERITRPIRARKKGGPDKGSQLPLPMTRVPGRYDHPRKNTPDTGPDSRFWIRLLSGKPRNTPRLGAYGKPPQIESRLPKYARFRWQITGFPGRWTGVIFAISNHLWVHEIG